MITALRDKGTKNLTLVCNSMGAPGELRGQILAENKQLKKLIAAFTVRPGMPTATEDQIVSGELEVELVPQGTLVERCRAGGAGIPAFYSATVAGTDLEKGKEVRDFDGRRYVLEPAIKLDFALLRAYRADRAGNVQFRGGSQNLNPAFAKAARVAIVEVDEIVEVGGIPPELINLPGIFVSRVVKSTYPFDPKQTPQSNRRPSDKPREYNGKPALTRAGIAKRAAAIVREGSYVNLGTGIPTMVSNFLEGRDVTLHAENGVLGYGKMVSGADVDPDMYNASGQYIAADAGRVVLRFGHLVRDGARRPHRQRRPRCLRSRPDRQRGQLEHRRRQARRHRRRDGPDFGPHRADHRDGALRQQGPAETQEEVFLPADRPGLRAATSSPTSRCSNGKTANLRCSKWRPASPRRK